MRADDWYGHDLCRRYSQVSDVICDDVYHQVGKHGDRAIYLLDKKYRAAKRKLEKRLCVNSPMKGDAMFVITIANHEISLLTNGTGVNVRINKVPTVLRREGQYLCYKDEDGKVNRCRIINQTPTGSGVHFACKSHGMEDEDHWIFGPHGTTKHYHESQENSMSDQTPSPDQDQQQKRRYVVTQYGTEVNVRRFVVEVSAGTGPDQLSQDRLAALAEEAGLDWEVPDVGVERGRCEVEGEVYENDLQHRRLPVLKMDS